jgi:hypothetical protein
MSFDARREGKTPEKLARPLQNVVVSDGAESPRRKIRGGMDMAEGSAQDDRGALKQAKRLTDERCQTRKERS